MKFTLFLNKALFAWIRLLDLPSYLLSRLAGLSYQIIVPANTYAPWLKDKTFLQIFWKNKKDSLVNIYQAWELWRLVGETNHIEGDILEVGVWRGSTSIIMGSRVKQDGSTRTIFACDTFEGVVKAGGGNDNYYKGGEHNNTSLTFTQHKIQDNGLDNIKLLKGIFPDETGASLQDRQFSLCHIDVDAYESGRGVLDWIWPRLSRGGVIVFNDYGFPLTKGITQLVNEQSSLNDRLVIHNLNGNGILVKIK